MKENQTEKSSRKSPRKTIIWIIIMGVLIIAGVLIYKNFSGNKSIPVTTEKAQKRNIIETVSANGKIQPEVELKISSDVSGEIVELFVKEGDQVKKSKIRLLLVDDHPLVREGLRSCLIQEKNIEIVGEAADGEDAIRQAKTCLPDIVLLDINMPEVSGLDMVEFLRRRPESKDLPQASRRGALQTARRETGLLCFPRPR